MPIPGGGKIVIGIMTILPPLGITSNNIQSNASYLTVSAAREYHFNRFIDVANAVDGVLVCDRPQHG